MSEDPVQTNPDHYTVVFENDRVRVLEYRDKPGHRSTMHIHPDSVMITASTFRRRLSSGTGSMEVELPAGSARWLPAQEHYGENIGDTDTHAFFVELKEPGPAAAAREGGVLGPGLPDR
ncbi:cytoplasmic protein [Arthrobacter sp. NPDC097144]|uniref:cytoplasmic protein n=1 Tax=Arthrobacter sp. NPDC097144 TaxID=3363946 RepID=UPI00381AEA3C